MKENVFLKEMDIATPNNFRNKHFDKISMIIVEKKLFHDRKKTTLANEAFCDQNIYHHAIMFRLYTKKGDNLENSDNLLAEINAEASINSIAPNIDSLDTQPESIDPLEKIILSTTHGAGCKLRVYSVNVLDYVFLSKYSLGYYISDISNNQFQDALNFIDTYEQVFGPIYVLTNVIAKPHTQNNDIDKYSYMSNLKMPYIHDNNCYSFVGRIINEMNISQSQLVTCFLPQRNYVSQFLTKNSNIIKIDTSTEKGIRTIFQYYKKLRLFSKIKTNKKRNPNDIKKLHALVMGTRLLNFEYMVVFQWNALIQKLDFFQITQPIDPFVSFAPYQIEHND